MLNLSGPIPGDDPGSPQSSTSTVRDPGVPLTVAVPVNLACLLPGVAGQDMPGLVMDNELYEVAFMTSPLPWSRYSKFPFGVLPSLITKPKLACAEPPLTLTVSAGSESRSTVI